MALVCLFIFTALSGCGNYYGQLKTDLGKLVESGDEENRAVYPVTPDKLAQVTEFTIQNNGYNILKAEPTPEGTYVVGRLTMKVMGVAVVTPIGALVRDEKEKGSSVWVISRSREDKADDVLGWIAESFKKNEKFAGWLKAGATAVTVPASAASTGPRDQVPIAVVDFTADGVSPSDASVISNLLRGALVKTGAFAMVEKSRMDAVLQEQAFQTAVCTDNECAVKLGKLLAVKKIIVGSCGKLMGDFFVTLRVVDVETGKIVTAEDIKGATSSEVQQGLKDFAGKLAERGV